MSKYKYSDFRHGQKCTCIIQDEAIEDARISISEGGDILICQNVFDGMGVKERWGYIYSWVILYKGEETFMDGMAAVRNLRIISQESETHMKDAKYGVTYDRNGDPTEFFATMDGVKRRIKELLRDENVNKDSIYVFEIRNMYKADVKPGFELRVL